MPTLTTIDNPDNPDSPKEISWKSELPLWAIPQLSFLKKTFPDQFIVTSATRDFNDPEQPLIVRIYYRLGRKYYIFRLYKKHMNGPHHVPHMDPTY